MFCSNVVTNSHLTLHWSIKLYKISLKTCFFKKIFQFKTEKHVWQKEKQSLYNKKREDLINRVKNDQSKRDAGREDSRWVGDGGEFVWFPLFLLHLSRPPLKPWWWTGRFAVVRTSEQHDGGLKITVTDLCWAWTPPPVKSRSPTTTLSVFTGGGGFVPLVVSPSQPFLLG